VPTPDDDNVMHAFFLWSAATRRRFFM